MKTEFKYFIATVLGMLLFSGSMAFGQFMIDYWYPNSDDRLQPIEDTWGIYTAQDLDWDGELLPDGATCSNAQILQKTGPNDWDCVAMPAGGGSGGSNWEYLTANAITPTSTIGIIVTASSTFANNVSGLQFIASASNYGYTFTSGIGTLGFTDYATDGASMYLYANSNIPMIIYSDANNKELSLSIDNLSANSFIEFPDIAYGTFLMATGTQDFITSGGVTTTDSFNVNNNFMIDGSGNLTVDGTSEFNGAVTGIALNEIENLETNKTFAMAANNLTFNFTTPSEGFTLNATGAFSDHILHVHQYTGNPAAGVALVHLHADDSDVLPLLVQASNPNLAEFGNGTATTTIRANYIDANLNGKASTTSQIGTLTNTKWCSTDGSIITCTEVAPGGFATTTADYWGSQRADTAISWSASGFAVTADGIGDTQLAFNT